MKNKIIILSTILLIIIGLVYVTTMKRDTTGTPLTSTSTNPQTGVINGGKEPPLTGASSTDVHVDNVSPNQVLRSPITITGEARGYYFEASFPVILLDADGKKLAEGPATAQSDWMTSDFVPFKITLTFPTPKTQTGTLIFKNDNPSGLPENDRSFIVPVRFDTANIANRTVKLYYYNPSLDKDSSGNILCSAKGLVSVTRSIPFTSSPLVDTMKLFLRGELTTAERNSGITTEYPLSGVELRSASIDSAGKTTINLLDPNFKTSGGACRANILRSQFEATAKQYPTVKSIIYTTEVFQP